MNKPKLEDYSKCYIPDIVEAIKCLNDLDKYCNELKKENKDLRNELCFKCGKFQNAFDGACDGCRWKQ